MILNPKGQWSYAANSRYTVPRNWRYLGEQPFGLGYRASTTGPLLDKPLPRGRKYMSLGQIGERGIAQRNAADYINHGIVSKPWRVEDDMYEWEIELDLLTGSHNEAVRVFVLEYDSSSKPQWLKPHYAYAWNSTSIDATTMYGGGIATAADRQVCLHHQAQSWNDTWDSDDPNDDNGVKYDAGETDLSTHNITKTQISDGSVTTITSDQKYLLFNDNARYKFEGKYIPTTSTKYAAIWICQWNADGNLIIYNVEMNSDKTSTTAITLRKGRLNYGKGDIGLGNVSDQSPSSLRTTINNLWYSDNPRAITMGTIFNFSGAWRFNMNYVQAYACQWQYYNGSAWSTLARVRSTGTSSTNLNFTGQHRCEDLDDSLSKTDEGLIVVSTGNYNNLIDSSKPTINESLPIVKLSSSRNQKSVFGVLSNKEDRNGERRSYEIGVLEILDPENYEDLDRLIINSLGEGAIWVCNINGNLENGDYITTCEIPGYGMRQDDDLLHNYTVAKITQDCTFELDNPYYDCVEFEFEGQTYRKAFVGCTYHCG